MANVFLSARKSTQVKAPVASATVIESGDLLYLDTGNDVRPASSQADNVGEEDNQSEFARNFAGVALHASASGDTDDVMVETALDKEYSFTVPSGTYRLGALLGASEASSGTALEDQQLEAVTSQDAAIAVVTDDSSSARTSVKCRFIRSVFSPTRVTSRPDVNVETLSGNKTMTSDEADVHFLDPGGSARDVLLPAEQEMAGRVLFLINTADMAEALTVKDDASGTTVASIAQNEQATIICSGTAWRASVGTST